AAGLGRRKRLAWVATTLIAAGLLVLYSLILGVALFVPNSVSDAPSPAQATPETLPAWLVCAMTANVIILLI
ncbi:putative integral membrane protein, partial [human gut metagenome]